MRPCWASAIPASWARPSPRSRRPRPPTPRAERAVLAGASGGTVIEDLFLATVHADGSVTDGYFTIRLSPMPDAHGAVRGGRRADRLTDVTRRVTAEQALRTSEERYQLALRAASGVGTWDWDIVADKVYADARYAVFHNVDPERAAGGLRCRSTARPCTPTTSSG
jgi:PAS domain-containing protein